MADAVWSMEAMVAPMERTAATVSSVTACTAWMLTPISSVALAVWLAKVLTSVATTAKPLPASPARAASMVALRARRLVWAAMSLMMPTMSPIRRVAWVSPWTVASMRWTSIAA